MPPAELLSMLMTPAWPVTKPLQGQAPLNDQTFFLKNETGRRATRIRCSTYKKRVAFPFGT
jgi:hypothetical protein